MARRKTTNAAVKAGSTVGHASRSTTGEVVEVSGDYALVHWTATGNTAWHRVEELAAVTAEKSTAASGTGGGSDE